MNKNELIEAVRTAQAEAGVKVNAASTLNSKSKAELEAMLADMSCGSCDNGEHCGACDCCPAEDEAEATEQDKPLNRKACNAALKAAGYEGPTSFLMPVLRELTRLVIEGTEHAEAISQAKDGRKVR